MCSNVKKEKMCLLEARNALFIKKLQIFFFLSLSMPKHNVLVFHHTEYKKKFGLLSCKPKSQKKFLNLTRLNLCLLRSISKLLIVASGRIGSVRYGLGWFLAHT